MHRTPGMTTTFPMTRDRFHLLTPFVLTPVLVAQGFFMGWALRLGPHPAPPVVTGVVMAVLPFIWLLLGITSLMAPTALVLTPHELVIERFAWPAVRVALSDINWVEAGPKVSLWGGGVRRLAGNGGWFWSGGLFRAEGVGQVRAWLTRLGPTVLLTRKAGLPVLVTADDADGFVKALKARV